jgi:hypothetical protein
MEGVMISAAAVATAVERKETRDKPRGEEIEDDDEESITGDDDDDADDVVEEEVEEVEEEG